MDASSSTGGASFTSNRDYVAFAKSGVIYVAKLDDGMGGSGSRELKCVCLLLCIQSTDEQTEHGESTMQRAALWLSLAVSCTRQRCHASGV